LTGAVVAVASVSFLAGAVGLYTDPTGAFYLLHSRAWELLLGALLALNVFPTTANRMVRNVEGLVGIALVLGSVLILSRSAPVPGLAAVPACAGAALIIMSGAQSDTLAARLLSLRFVVFVGLISYSLYLWHWPVVVLFKEYRGVDAFSRLQKAEILVLSFALAVPSWWFVERPCRKARVPRSTVFSLATLVSAAIGLGALAMIAFQGFPTRFSPEVARISAYAEYDTTHAFRAGTCFIDSSYHFEHFDAEACLKPDARRPNVLVVGDSHAAALWPGLSSVLKNANVMQATASGCKGVVVEQPYAAPRCTRLMEYVFRQFLPSTRIDRLVFAGRWEEPDLADIQETLRWAKRHGITVVLVGPIVEYAAPLPKLLARGLQEHNPVLPAQHKVAGRREADRALARLAEANGTVYVSVYDILCPADRCLELTPDGTPVQFDYGHLTREGSTFVAEAALRNGVFGSM
jgi:hypothetical protein